jgi:probable nitrogen fixation protein
MSETKLTPVQTPFAQELVRQVRSLDTYDMLDGQNEAEMLDPFIMTKQRKREIPLVGDPDEIVMARVRAFYNAVATSIETASGLRAVPMLKTSYEGFGRVLITVGKLVVLDKTLRDLHRFGFPSFEQLNTRADRMIENAIVTIKAFREAAEA